MMYLLISALYKLFVCLLNFFLPYLQTDGWTPDLYIMLSARRGQHNN